MNPSGYEEIVRDLRQAFPQPVSDRLHDSYLVFSFMRVLDKVDQLKSQRPLLGEPETLDYNAARQFRLDQGPASLESVNDELVSYLSGMFIWGHPRSQINVIPAPTIPSIIGGLLPSLYNPNLSSDEASRRIALAEVSTLAMVNDLVGYDPETAGGVFTFGGTGTLLYALRMGLEKACPGTAREGVSGSPVILCSERAHYACLTAASWLGIGSDQVIKIPADEANAVSISLYQDCLRELLAAGRRVAGIVATMGTTDAFGIDDLESIRMIRDELVKEFALDYVPQLHADAVIGWAWSVFSDYDFEANSLEFRGRTVRALAAARHRIRHLAKADSIGIDFHKTGFTPYISSAIIVRDAADLGLLARDDQSMPYLFQSGEYHPGKFTLETSRAGSGPLAAYANLRLLGKDGFRALLGHLVTMAEQLREGLSSKSYATVLNPDNHGPVTLFRLFPDGIDTFQMPQREQTDSTSRDLLRTHNDYNRRVFALVHEEALRGEGVVLSLTDCYRWTDYGEPVVALKSYIMSPFTEEDCVQIVLDSLQRARQRIAEQEL